MPAGALLGVGVAGASAATVLPTPTATHSSVSVHSHHRSVSLIEQLRVDLFQGQIDGSRAQALATRIAANTAMFSALPAGLQSDLTALKHAPRSADTARTLGIEKAAAAGAYGQQIQTLAQQLGSQLGSLTGNK